MTRIIAVLFALAATPALAAEGEPFFSLRSTEFIVTLAFLLFIGVLLYFKVPTSVAAMLDKRSDGIRSELDEARSLREEAQALLASYDRKRQDVQAQADRIVANARDEATRAATQAKADIVSSVDRRMAAAEEQLASAQAAAIRDVRNRAVTAAVGAARQVMAAQMTADRGNALIDEAIATVDAKMH